jgi:hypothetical protein
LKKNYLDVTEFIRSIQRAEGNPDCFRKTNGYCDRLDCAWREYCLEEPHSLHMNGNNTHEENSVAPGRALRSK